MVSLRLCTRTRTFEVLLMVKLSPKYFDKDHYLIAAAEVWSDCMDSGGTFGLRLHARDASESITAMIYKTTNTNSL